METTVASASEDIMQSYAELVVDVKIRDKFMSQILEEFRRTTLELKNLFGNDIQERRPHVTKSIELREPGLRILHQIQIDQIRSWRAQNDGIERDRFIDHMLVTINAIAGGLRNTG